MDQILSVDNALKHGTPAPLDKLLPSYLFFFFSCLASFFSLAVFCGFFFSAFFVSFDLVMWLPSLMQAQDFTLISSITTTCEQSARSAFIGLFNLWTISQPLN